MPAGRLSGTIHRNELSDLLRLVRGLARKVVVRSGWNNRVHAPKVSIIVRTQGSRPALLKQALRSLVLQSYPIVEAIVVEDGSDTLASFVALVANERPDCFRHLPVPVSGRSAAGNQGFENATGEWIGLLDEDDILFPEHIETLVRAVTSDPQNRLVFARATPEICFGLANDRVDRPMLQEPIGDAPFSRLNLWASNRYAIQAALFHREMYRDLGGFDERLDALEDWDLWLRYTAAVDPLALPQTTSKFRVAGEASAELDRRRKHAEARPLVLGRHAAEKGLVVFSDVAALYERADRQHTLILGLRIILIAVTERMRLFWERIRRPIAS